MSTALIRPGKRAAAAATEVRAVIYLRLSDLRSEDRDTFKEREDEVRKYAALLGWTVVAVIIENDYSKKNGKVRIASAFKRVPVTVIVDGQEEVIHKVIRPGYQKVLKGIRSGQWNAILAEDLDRVVRDPFDGEALLNLATQYRVNARSVSGSLTLTGGGSPDEQTMFRVMVAFAYKASCDTARRVRLACERNMCRAMGRGGPRPYGWKSDYKTADPLEKDVLKEVMRRFLLGIELASIVREMNEAGIPTVTGGLWSAETLRSTLLRPRNAGLVVYRKEIQEGLTGEWDALCSVPMYWAVRNKLADSSRRSQFGRPAKWQGSGIYLCAACNDGTTVSVTGTREDRSASYRCRKKNHLTCTVTLADATVEDAVVERLSQKDVLYMWAPRETTKVDVEALMAERTALQQNSSAMAIEAVKDRRMWGDYVKVREFADSRIAEIDRDIQHASTAGDIVTEFLSRPDVKDDIRAAFKAAPLATRRQIVRTIMKVEIHATSTRASYKERDARVKITPIQWTPDQIAA